MKIIAPGEVLDNIMFRLGFTAFDRGYYVSELREYLEYKIENQGLQNMSASWSITNEYDKELRAKSLLAWYWEVDNGYTYKTELFDPLWGWKTNLRTMKKSFYFRWHKLPAWWRDYFRYLRMKLHKLWTFRKYNPYRY